MERPLKTPPAPLEVAHVAPSECPLPSQYSCHSYSCLLPSRWQEYFWQEYSCDSGFCSTASIRYQEIMKSPARHVPLRTESGSTIIMTCI